MEEWAAFPYHVATARHPFDLAHKRSTWSRWTWIQSDHATGASSSMRRKGRDEAGFAA